MVWSILMFLLSKCCRKLLSATRTQVLKVPHKPCFFHHREKKIFKTFQRNKANGLWRKIKQNKIKQNWRNQVWCAGGEESSRRNRKSELGKQSGNDVNKQRDEHRRRALKRGRIGAGRLASRGQGASSSCKRPWFDYHYLPGASHLSITPSPEGSVSSSDFPRHQECMLCNTYMKSNHSYIK